MNQFKVGDAVSRKRPFEDGTILKGVVEEVVSSHTINIRITKGNLNAPTHSAYRGHVRFWELAHDDSLPPPELSVLYVKDSGRRTLRVTAIEPERVHLTLRLDNRGLRDTIGYSLTPDEALQLAHDLRRQAMYLKRKEKEES